jgi:ribosome-binding protein aMBF1 (putative translation factor)
MYDDNYGLHPDQIVLDHEARENARQRTAVSQGVYKAKRARALVDPKAHALKKARLTFGRDGLTQSELSARSTVAESVIRDLEAGGYASDATWERLSRALGLPRHFLDPRHIYVPSA